MSEVVVPIVPALQTHVDTVLARQRASARAAQRRYNLFHHGLPTGAGLTLLAGVVAVGLIAPGAPAPAEDSPSCGVGVVEAGAGHYSVLDSALANAGVTAPVRGYEHAVDRLAEIDPTLHPGERFVVPIQDGQIVINGIRQIHQPVNSCAELPAHLTPQN